MYIDGRLLKETQGKAEGVIFVEQFYSGYVYSAPKELVGVRMDIKTNKPILTSDGYVEVKISEALDDRVKLVSYAMPDNLKRVKPRQ
jgi:hypothetical protein